MALNFPNSPSVGDIYVDNETGFSYQWSGEIWKSYKVNTDSLGGNLDADLNLNSNDITGTGDVDTTGNLKISGIATASSFVKSSGTSSQFLKADGSVDSSTYLTSYTETNDLSSAVTWANVPDANITESSVTQHQAALSITESQISDLQTYLTSYIETDPVVGAIDGIVKANGSGTISTALAGTDYLTPSGDGSGLSGLTGASAATYGSAGATPVIVVDSDGRITGISTVATSGAGGGGISNIVEDITPQLGGDLDLNGNDIIGTGDITITSTDAGSSAGPELTLYRNSASPAPGDYLGQLMFKGENSNGGEENYAKITGKISDETLGTEDGLIETAIKGNGSFVIVSRQKSNELQLINGVGLSVDGTISGNLTGDVTGNITGVAATFSGDVSIGGTLTYQDVTNVDSVGLVTARTGVRVTTGGLEVSGGGAAITGIVTATSFSGDGSNLTGLNVPTGFNELDAALFT